MPLIQLMRGDSRMISWRRTEKKSGGTSGEGKHKDVRTVNRLKERQWSVKRGE